MVEHDWNRRHFDQILDSRDDCEIRINLDVPLARLHARGRGLQPLARDIRIIRATGREIEPDATYTHLPHLVEIALCSLVVDDCNASRVLPRACIPHSVARLSVP